MTFVADFIFFNDINVIFTYTKIYFFSLFFGRYPLDAEILALSRHCVIYRGK